MINFSYSPTPTLQAGLQTFQLLWKDLMLAPLPTKNARRFRWDAMLTRLDMIRAFLGLPLSKRDLTHLLAHPAAHRLSPQLQVLLTYRSTWWSLWQELSYTDHLPSITAVSEFLDPIGKSLRQAGYKMQRESSSLRQTIAYLSAAREHPLIAAAVAYAMLLPPSFSQTIPELLFVYPVSYLYLFVGNYETRGLVTLEDIWDPREKSASERLSQGRVSGNYTPWLEYAVQQVNTGLEKRKGEIAAPPRTEVHASFWQLNDRQKNIILSLEQPTATITNHDVQRRFKVSQITASRDLAKLVSLGLLLSRGKGRSTSYVLL